MKRMRFSLTFRCLLLVTLLSVLSSAFGAPAGEVDKYVRLEMAQQHIPGLSLCVIRDGRVIKAQSYGLANVELNVPATLETEFSIASMTKSVTAIAVMLLVQDGKLGLDDRISKYFSGLPDNWQAITIRHLLTHTSGIKDHFHDFPFPTVKLDRKLEYTDEEFLKAHFDAGLNFKPGAQWAYSGSGFTLLGMIIQKVTGKPYADFLRERIFAPLGMTRTHVISVNGIIPNRAAGYRWVDGALRNGNYTGQTFSGGADVSLLTTASDLARWDVALSSKGLWQETSVKEMWTPATLADGREVAKFPAGSYGLGWALNLYNGHHVILHGGSFITGFSSVILNFPDKGLSVIVLTNQHEANPAQIAYGVVGLYDADLLAPHRRRIEVDHRPELKEKASAFLAALFTGSDASAFVTPGLLSHMPAVPKSPANQMFPTGRPDLTFIASEDIRQRRIERYGTKLAEARHYKAKFDDQDVYLTFYLAADGSIADYGGY